MLKQHGVLIKAFLLFTVCFVGRYSMASGQGVKRQMVDTPYYNVDGKKASGMTLAPAQIAFIQVLDAKQAQIIFGPGYGKGAIYVTSTINKYADINTGIQEKINKLFPPAGSYLQPSRSRTDALIRGMELAERDKWLVVINGKSSTLEALRVTPLSNIIDVSYHGGDMSEKYGSEAKNGVLVVTTSALGGNNFFR